MPPKHLMLGQLPLDSKELSMVVGGGCTCRCLDKHNAAFKVDCVPEEDYCTYLCEKLLGSLRVKASIGECDARSFHGGYPEAWQWVNNQIKLPNKSCKARLVVVSGTYVQLGPSLTRFEQPSVV